MKMHRLLMGLLITAAQASAAAAMADVMEIVVPTKAGVSPPNAVAEIKVDGAGQHGPYDSVTSKTLDYIVAVRGDKPKKAAGGGLAYIYLGTGEAMTDVKSDWSYHAISAPYEDPWSNQVGNLRLSPVDLCNQRLNQTSGAARATFLKKGVTFGQPSAYAITGSIVWYMKKPLGFEEPKRYTSGTLAPVKITCLALDRPRVRQDSHTKPAPKPTGQKMKPTISDVGLRIEPASVVQDGKYLCPTKLKLYGTVDVIRKFYGKALFVGPHYLSNITVLNFQDKGHRNVVGTYNIDWHKMGGLATQANAEPAKQTLTFRFNVADKDNKVLESVEETVEVSCRKVKVNAPTASGDMTVKPAN